VLPDGRTILSSDGKSYKDPRTGQVNDLPSDAIRVSSDTGFDASRQAKVQSRAQTELDSFGPGVAQPTIRPAAEKPASGGTGPYSNLQSALNATAGGLGIDKAFGVKGFYPENEANRQYLTSIRQAAKTAFVNNPRFPVAEQKIVDQMFPDPSAFWANPRTEAGKIPILRSHLEEQLRTNNEALASGALPKEESARLETNNIETRRALRLLGHGDSSLKVLEGTGSASPGTAAAPAAPGGGFATRWDALAPNAVVMQGGKKYRKLPNGEAEEVK
jgi:hypothetical protein